MLGLRLNTLHNVHFFLDLMAQARRAIEEGVFARFMASQLERWRAGPQ
jgi:queuine tRNA-ribosyltransferase